MHDPETLKRLNAKAVNDMAERRAALELPEMTYTHHLPTPAIDPREVLIDSLAEAALLGFVRLKELEGDYTGLEYGDIAHVNRVGWIVQKLLQSVLKQAGR